MWIYVSSIRSQLNKQLEFHYTSDVNSRNHYSPCLLVHHEPNTILYTKSSSLYKDLQSKWNNTFYIVQFSTCLKTCLKSWTEMAFRTTALVQWAVMSLRACRVSEEDQKQWHQTWSSNSSPVYCCLTLTNSNWWSLSLLNFNTGLWRLKEPAHKLGLECFKQQGLQLLMLQETRNLQLGGGYSLASSWPRSPRHACFLWSSLHMKFQTETEIWLFLKN